MQTATADNTTAHSSLAEAVQLSLASAADGIIASIQHWWKGEQLRQPQFRYRSSTAAAAAAAAAVAHWQAVLFRPLATAAACCRSWLAVSSCLYALVQLKEGVYSDCCALQASSTKHQLHSSSTLACMPPAMNLRAAAALHCKHL